MKATLTIITMPMADPKPSDECRNSEITDYQVVMEQLPQLLRRMESGLTNSCDVEWVDHTVTGLVDRLQQAIHKSDLMEMTLCHSALKYEPPRRIDKTGRDITLFPAKWQKSDAWMVPGVGNA
jgi:hypothetical protein